MTATTARDPRLDPIAGDELEKGDVRRVKPAAKADRVAWDIVGADGAPVPGLSGESTLKQFRRWSAKAIVRLSAELLAANVAARAHRDAVEAHGAASPEAQEAREDWEHAAAKAAPPERCAECDAVLVLGACPECEPAPVLQLDDYSPLDAADRDLMLARPPMEPYQAFVARKLTRAPSTGLVPPDSVGAGLFSFQRDLVRWALRRGRAAIFANTGLGKTRMQLEWAAHVQAATGKPVLILAPLAVGAQTAAEAELIGVPVVQARGPMDLERAPIAITNYERLEKFNCARFGAVVLDESSCIKHHDTKTLKQLLEAFRDTPFKLCCSATPAPNDWTELGTHAEFLGACSRPEMLSEFFVHDGGETQKWRLKGHAREAFWRWVASWGALVSHPRDLGYEEGRYDLPELRVREHVIKAGKPVEGSLFVMEAETLMERRRARRASIDERVRACVDVITREPGEAWVVWCDLNDESQALVGAIPGAVEITGSMGITEKERALTQFGRGEHRVLVTKPSIAGYGLNWQHCARMAFVGVTDSWESYYQAVRRCWRFGQARPVDVHVFASEAEGSVVANLKRKDADASAMAAALAQETAATVRAEVRGIERTTNDYRPEKAMEVPSWAVTA